jgi:crotonobetainyl-CoA:carnitine CoA-transferase CaiB-like acyl-CoA transferase
MCGEEGGTPLHLGYPISDAIGGLFGAIGVLAELVRLKNFPADRGQEIDCAVTEAMMRTLDFLAIEYDQLGVVRTSSGNRSQYAAPGNIYATSDGKWASIAASTQSIFERFCTALGLQHLLKDPRFIDNPARVKNWQAIDAIVGDAIARLTLEELRSRLHAYEVGFSPIYDAADIFADPHFIARQTIVSVPDHELGDIRMQCVVPRFSETPVSVRCAGPSLGQHNDETFGALGLTAQEIARLRAAGTI